jgi:hypothetical protein
MPLNSKQHPQKKSIKTVREIYAAVDSLVAELNSLKFSKLANALSIRVHGTWTTGSELLEELQTVMTQGLRIDGERLPRSIRKEVEDILRAIEHVLTFIQRSSTIQNAPKVTAQSQSRGVLVEKKKKR